MAPGPEPRSAACANERVAPAAAKCARKASWVRRGVATQEGAAENHGRSVPIARLHRALTEFG